MWKQRFWFDECSGESVPLLAHLFGNRNMFGRKKKAPPRAGPSAEELAVLSRVLQHYPAGTKLHFGAPVRCPQCGDFGMASDVDYQAGVTDYFCMHCAIEWSLSRRALRRAPDAPVPITVTGLGDMFDQLDHLKPKPIDVALAGDLHLLLVEDDQADAELVKTILSSAPSTVDLAHASSRREGEAIATRGGVDLVLLDLGLPESSGLSTLSNWQVAAPPSPIVVVSGDNRPGLVDGLRQIGASQFLHKTELVPLLDRGAEGTAALVDFLRFVVANDPGTTLSAAPNAAASLGKTAF